MLKALMLKELRDVRGIAVLALLLYTCLLTYAITPTIWWDYVPVAQLSGKGMPSEPLLPFIRDRFTSDLAVVSAVLAIALGLWQSAGETKRGTFAFLLHRPVTRRRVIGLKLLVGAMTYAFCAAIPLLAYCVWAATPGTHAGPFEWSMTWSAWTGWWAATLLYAGAFLTGIRPARWYGTRPLPLIVALAGYAMSTNVALSYPQTTLWVWLVILVADFWVISAILFVSQTRDFS